MRQITRSAINAFMEGENFSKSNTEVFCTPTGVTLFLHNNPTARRFKDGTIQISSAGWQTNTTKERLNGIPGVSIVQKNFEWFLNDQPWDGSWITI